MIWLNFNARVKELLLMEDKMPKTGFTQFIDGSVRQAVIDLQSYIPGYTVGHVSEMRMGDFVQDGNAMRGTFPDQMTKMLSIIYHRPEKEVDEDTTICELTTDLSRQPWEYRTAMIKSDCLESSYLYAPDDRMQNFYIHPVLGPNDTITFEWNGRKTLFQENDKLPWGEETLQCVADFVCAQTSRKQEKLDDYKSYFSSYLKNRSRLVREDHEKNL